MEEAEAYQKLLGDFTWTQDELAHGSERIEARSPTRSASLDFRNPSRTTCARAPDHGARPAPSAWRQRTVETPRSDPRHSWSVRTTEEGVSEEPSDSAARSAAAELETLEGSLQSHLLTKVRITGSERRGRIEISYATSDELERLVALLGCETEAWPIESSSG